MATLENGNGHNGGNSHRHPHWGWVGSFLLFGTGVFAYVVFVLGPSFSSPRSRVYASALGYPSIQRLLGKPIELTAVEKVGTRPMVQIVSAEGSLGYFNEIPISCEVAGIITQVLVEPGSQIHPGDVLLRVNGGGQIRHLDELKLEEARAAYRLTKSAWERAKSLYKSAAVSHADLEIAELTFRQAEAALAESEQRFKYALISRSQGVAFGLSELTHQQTTPEVDIVSTVTGTVFKRTAQVGQNLTTRDRSQALFLVGDRLTFLAAFDQRYASSVREGDKGKFYLKAYPGVAFQANVVRLANNLEPENHKVNRSMSDWVQKQPPDTFYAWLDISTEATEGRKLMTGMNGYCLFERPFSSLAIPESALMRYSGRSGMVLVVDSSSRLQVRSVTYSGTADGWVAIESGLQEGEQIVTEGQLGLKAGDQVSVTSN